MEEDAIKNKKDIFKRQEHDSDFLSLTSVPCIQDTQDWIDKNGVKGANSYCS